MRDSENLYDKIRELIGNVPGSFNILEEEINVDLQVEYFELSKRMAEEYNADWALDQIDLLEDPDYPPESKKQLLARLATLEDVSAYRAIEGFARFADEELRDWSMLALQESRMHLESNLLGENQVFISTGLGGRDHKLRYFVALISRNEEILNPFQVKIIGDEFPFALSRYQGEVEEYQAEGYLATFLLLLPIQYSVKEVFSEAIKECNQYGDFLRDNCIVTNVKKLTFNEIIDFIERRSE